MSRLFLTTVSCVALILSACSSDEAPPPPLPSDVASVVRGQQIVEGFGACGFCHSLDGKPGTALSGGRIMSDVFGDVAGPNITLAQTGIGNWSEVNFRAFVRSSARPDGSYLYSSFHRGLEWMSDSDLSAIIAYLRTLPSVDSQVERRDIGFIGRNTTGFFRSPGEVMGYVPQISQGFRLEYGEYLTNSVAGCAKCHNRPGGTFSSDEPMAGGEEITFGDETKVAPNITQSKETGIGNWSDDDMRMYLSSGRTPAGRTVDTRFCPIEFYQRANPAEIDAVVAYLRTISAVE